MVNYRHWYSIIRKITTKSDDKRMRPLYYKQRDLTSEQFEGLSFQGISQYNFQQAAAFVSCDGSGFLN